MPSIILVVAEGLSQLTLSAKTLQALTVLHKFLHITISLMKKEANVKYATKRVVLFCSSPCINPVKAGETRFLGQVEFHFGAVEH